VQSSWQQLPAQPRDAGETDKHPARQRAERRESENANLPPLPDEAYAFEDDGQQITYRLAVGHRGGAQPGNIVGAIANEARLAGQQINGVDIRADYTLVRLPAQLSKAVLDRLSQVKIRGNALNLEVAGPPRREPKAGHRKGGSFKPPFKGMGKPPGKPKRER
jgi:ATP-dependent RNA helicase DeaD